MSSFVAEIRLLGRYSLRAGPAGTPARSLEIPSRKARALLAYLAMQEGEEVDRERLADLLWGNSADHDARHNLRQCIVTLHKILAAACPDLLVARRQSVSLRAELISVDALSFLNAVAKGELATALALYHGEFFAGLNVETESFKDWARAERSRFATIAASAFERAAAERDVAGHGAGAIAAAERLVALDPLREDWQRLLLRLYARYLGRSTAMAHARELAALLKRDLDIEPEAATMALVEDIRRGAPLRSGSVAEMSAMAS